MNLNKQISHNINIGILLFIENISAAELIDKNSSMLPNFPQNQTTWISDNRIDVCDKYSTRFKIFQETTKNIEFEGIGECFSRPIPLIMIFNQNRLNNIIFAYYFDKITQKSEECVTMAFSESFSH